MKSDFCSDFGNIGAIQICKYLYISNLRIYGETIRYVDPVDPAIMHERHAIYRIEQKPEWVTRSPQNQTEVLLGPILGLRKPEYAPEPLPGETARDLAEAHRGLKEANKEVQVVRQNQEKLAGSVESLARRTAEAQQKLTTILSVVNERLKRLEGDNGTPVDLPTDSKGIQPGGSNTGRWRPGITPAVMKRCIWVEPVLIAQVKFTEWTSDDQLRQPVFLGLRSDKKPEEVVRE